MPGGFEFPERLGITTYSLGVDFAYELDFWGRARNDSRAAAMQYLASESDFRAARIGVLSETITTYFEIVDLRRRSALARETAEVLREGADLAEDRYDRGLATSFELYQARQALSSAQAAIPQLESQLTNAEGRLGVLIGGFRAKLDAILPDSLAPVAPGRAVAAGVPADLLLQRPDVRAAGQRLEAARFAIGARRAELLPSLSLSGTIGLQSADVDGLFRVDQWFRNLIGGLTAPIFQGGRIRNNIALAHASFGQAAAAYGRAVVTAVHEVEGALGRAGQRGTPPRVPGIAARGRGGGGRAPGGAVRVGRGGLRRPTWTRCAPCWRSSRRWPARGATSPWRGSRCTAPWGESGPRRPRRKRRVST